MTPWLIPLVLIAAASLSATQDPTQNSFLRRFDTNGDGKIDDNERRALQERLRHSQGVSDAKIPLDFKQTAAVRRWRSALDSRPVPAGLERRTIKVGTLDREYFVNIPDRAKGKPAPVVFVLHGGAVSTGLAMHLKCDFTTLGKTEGYVTVYPSGINGWNIGSHDSYSVKRRTNDADDIGFFRAMFDQLVRDKIADPNRLYVAGGSNGGVMTQYLVHHLADRIAGAGVLVATLPRSAAQWPRPSRPVPIAILLGTEDPMKPWNGSRDQMSAAETVAYWRRINGCQPIGKKAELPDRDPGDGCRVRTERWEGNQPVLFATLEGHGHGWPMQRGKRDAGTDARTRDIDAPNEFWKFFQPKPDPATLPTR